MVEPLSSMKVEASQESADGEKDMLGLLAS